MDNIGDSTRCRLCRSTQNVYIDVFDPAGTNNLLVWRVIKEFTGLEVNDKDGLPPVICLHCMQMLIQFKNFKSLCIRSRIEYLKDMVYQGIVERPAETALFSIPVIKVEDFPGGTSSGDFACRVKKEAVDFEEADVKPLLINGVVVDPVDAVPSPWDMQKKVPEMDSCARTTLRPPVGKQKNRPGDQEMRIIPRVVRNPFSTGEEQGSWQVVSTGSGKKSTAHRTGGTGVRSFHALDLCGKDLNKGTWKASCPSVEVDHKFHIKKEVLEGNPCGEIVLKECCVMLKDVLRDPGNMGNNSVTVFGGKRSKCDSEMEQRGGLKRKRIKVQQGDVGCKTAVQKAQNRKQQCKTASPVIVKVPGKTYGGQYDKSGKEGRKTVKGSHAVKQEGEDGRGETTASNSVKRKSQGRPKCPVCHMVFNSWYSKTNHMISYHPKLKVPKNKCNICKQIFAFPYILRAHQAKHSRKLPFRCKVCSLGFETNRSLSVHTVKIHAKYSHKSK